MNMNKDTNFVDIQENEAVSSDTDSNTTFVKRDYAPHRRTSYRICKECGKMYVLSDNDAIHYISKYGNLPLRCEKCREKKYEKMDNKNE